METKQQRQYAEKVREGYSPRKRTAFDDLKELDKKVKKPAEAFAYAFGTVAALILGTGMCLAMKVIGDLFALGIVVGCVGIALCVANYFLYKAILNSRKKKYGAQILKLTDELLQ